MILVNTFFVNCIMIVRLLLSVLCILLSFSGFCQECKYAENKIDEFTKDTIKTVGAELMSGGYQRGLLVWGKVINSTRYLYVNYANGSIYSIADGAKYMFLLTNDSIVTLHTDESYIADNHSSSAGFFWYAHVSLKLDNSTFNALLSAPLKKLRFYTRDGYVEKEIKEKKRSRLHHVLKCIE